MLWRINQTQPWSWRDHSVTREPSGCLLPNMRSHKNYINPATGNDALIYPQNLFPQAQKMLLRHHLAFFSWSICAIISVAAALIPQRFPQVVPQELTQEITTKESTDLLETDYKVVGRAIEECSRTSNKYSCLANKAAMAMERAVNWDIPIFGGLEFAVDEDKIQNVSETTRGFADGVSRLSGAVAR